MGIPSPKARLTDSWKVVRAYVLYARFLVDEAYLVAVHHIHTFGERHADTALAVVNQTSRHVVDADLGIGSGNNL